MLQTERELQREIRRKKMMEDDEKYNEDNKEFLEAVKYIENTAVDKIKTVYSDRLSENLNELLHEEIPEGFGFDVEGYKGKYVGFSWNFSTSRFIEAASKTEIIKNNKNISSNVSEKIIYDLDEEIENKLSEANLTLRDVLIEITEASVLILEEDRGISLWFSVKISIN